jgi:hypothetical protein
MNTRRSLTLALAVAFTGACFTGAPLSRSYDDPWNAPLPNEDGPTTLTPAEEECVRTNSPGCVQETTGSRRKDGMCDADADCVHDGDVCYQRRCIPRSELPPR